MGNFDEVTSNLGSIEGDVDQGLDNTRYQAYDLAQAEWERILDDRRSEGSKEQMELGIPKLQIKFDTDEDHEEGSSADSVQSNDTRISVQDPNLKPEMLGEAYKEAILKKSGNMICLTMSMQIEQPQNATSEEQEAQLKAL